VKRRNSTDAPLKRQTMGREAVVVITNRRLDLGPWEQILYGEYVDRQRKLYTFN
jgi:thiamine phosphate synthase YjbQ (UPF0047 family)